MIDGQAGVLVDQAEVWLDLELGEGIVVFHPGKRVVVSEYFKSKNPIVSKWRRGVSNLIIRIVSNTQVPYQNILPLVIIKILN